jgi:hypothetical protein
MLAQDDQQAWSVAVLLLDEGECGASIDRVLAHTSSSIPVVWHWAGQALASTAKPAVSNRPTNGETRRSRHRDFSRAVDALEPVWNPGKEEDAGIPR